MNGVLRSRPARLSAAAGAAVLLAGCGGGDSSSDDQTATVTETVTATESATESSTPTDDADDGSTGGGSAAAGLPPRPKRDECVEITTPRNGRYTVYDAGRAVVTRNGDRLRVRSVNAAKGWTARTTDDDGDDDVEIEFRPRAGGAELELEVELDDGRVESKICADDRDDDDD